MINLSGTALRTLIGLIGAGILLSCDRKIDILKNTNIQTLPAVTVKNFETVYTDSARLQLVMVSPLAERYTNHDSPYSEFRFGIKVLFHDGHKEPVASITAKYAKLTGNDKLWELKDSVVAINQKNEKLETELLYWDQEKGRVYTDRFVRITSEDQIVSGFGLESDSRFTSWRIKKVSATLYLKDE
jgi:LPS export ABC transporter protein LptC